MADFAKYHALGNDYLIIDPQCSDLPPTAHAARWLCDRRFGIGADGVLFGPCSPVEPEKPVEVVIFNADGSVCGRSGNGIRIFALYLAEHYLNSAESTFTVRTAAGDSPVDIRDIATGSVRIGMGWPSFDPSDIPVLGLTGQAIANPLILDTETLMMACVNVGTPHAVVFLEDLSAERARELGPRVAGHARFPQRTNVNFARVIDRTTIQIEIWERGAGYTTASGAGSCATASAAHALGLIGEEVTVRMPGGDLDVAVAPDGSITLTGVVEKVATGDFASAYRARLEVPRP